MPRQGLGTVEQRQGIDEAKKLDLDRLVTHGPVHEALVPPRRRQEGRPMTIHTCEQLFAVDSSQSFDFFWRDHTVILPSPAIPLVESLLSFLQALRPIGAERASMSSARKIGKFHVLGNLGAGANSQILHVRCSG